MVEVTADCKCDDCSHQWVLDKLRVKLTIDVAYAQGYGPKFTAFVLDNEHEHEDELQAWAANEGKNKAQTHEDQLKKKKFTSQDQCKAANSQVAVKRINDGWQKAKKDSREKHDVKGMGEGDHLWDGSVWD